MHRLVSSAETQGGRVVTCKIPSWIWAEMCTCEFKRSRNVTACWRDITVTPREVNITNDLENLQFGPTLGQRRIRWPSVETTCFVSQNEWSHGLVGYISHRVILMLYLSIILYLDGSASSWWWSISIITQVERARFIAVSGFYAWSYFHSSQFTPIQQDTYVEPMFVGPPSSTLAPTFNKQWFNVSCSLGSVDE